MLLAGDKIATENFVGGIWGGLATNTFVDHSSATYQLNWSIGTYLHWRLSDHWGLVPEIGFKMPAGANGMQHLWSSEPAIDTLVTERKESVAITYFSIPMFVRYNIGAFAVFGGPQVGYILKATDVLEGNGPNGESLTIEKDALERFNRWDLGVAAGIEWIVVPSFGIHSFRVGLRYYRGFMNVSTSGTETGYNQTIMATFGVPIGGSPKTKAEATLESE